MNRVVLYAALAGLVGVSAARATEIETFDSPNLLQQPTLNAGTTPVNRYHQINDTASFSTATYTYGATSYGIASATGGYGSGYHNIFTDDLPPPVGSPNNPTGATTNGVVDISGNNMLQLDVTINSGLHGLFIDLIDGEGDFHQYFYGYGRSGNAAADTAAGLQPGEVILQGAAPNQEIFQVPLVSTGFDLSQVVLFRIEDDPGASPSYDIAFNDLSGVSVPEPTSIAGLAIGCVVLGRRRRR